MPPSLPTTLLLLHLLAGAPSASGIVPGQTALPDERHIELTADGARQDWEVRISPNQASNLMFNAPLRRGSVTVQERELFQSVMVDENAGLITLLPSAMAPPGKTVMLVVGFADNNVPENTTFRLVVRADQVERQVRVDRKPLSASFFQEEARQARERAEHCETALGRQTTRKCQEDLVGLFSARLVKKGIGIRSLDFFSDLPQSPADSLFVKEAYSYRAIGRVAVELWLDESHQQPWRVKSAELVTEEGHSLRVLRTWQSPGVLRPGDLRQIVVEAEAPEPQSQESFLLRLTEAEGTRTLTVRGVTFP
ncbi:hypothetical protein CYFUS_000895 [Cystobacter fuscus]|uniref:DUF2381 family protein n=1 Tax=Cystobacter fuscus TaxID=43 RepID=A0A250IW72_9BACT|nr:DUF2381 family protein [Cystobacter fuscus]ATB35482.1 hypothetical protein CYFUS_000895 [Cystobacter fuscus]